MSPGWANNSNINSYACFILKIALQKHSQDKNEIDKITLTQDMDFSDQGFTPEAQNFLEG